MKKITIILICLMMLLSSIPVSAAETSDNEMPVVVSLGDSYSSGEGVQDYYGQNSSDKYTCEDWIAHRSENAWPGLLEYNGKALNTVRAKNPAVLNGLTVDDSCKDNGSWYFTAVSGATTQDIISLEYTDVNGETQYSLGQKKEVERPMQMTAQVSYYDSKDYKLNLQIDTVKAVQAKQEIDYITMTIGGNDVGFSDIVTTAVLPWKSSWIDMSSLKNELVTVINDFWNEDSNSYSNRIKKTYDEILKAAPSATLVIAGYPQLLHLNEDKSGNGMFINYEESRLIDSAVLIFNDYINTLVENMNTEQIIFVDVQEKFINHGAYSNDPYLYGIEYATDEEIHYSDIFDMVSKSSFHPNEKGVQAYAEAVQESLAEIDTGFAETYYSTDAQLEVYDSNGEIYGNYTVEVNGKEYKNIIGNFDFWGLWKQDYHKTFTVTERQALSLNLPKGNYTFTITDALDTDKTISKPIKIRSGNENSKITIISDFGNVSTNETMNGHFEVDDILDGAVEFNGHWYKVIDDLSITNWDAAKQYCNSHNGYLATITSQAENDFVYNYVTNDCGYESAYFGLTDNYSEGTWQWDNSEKATYTNWHQNEPNGENSNEDYAMFYYKYSDGTWNDGDFGNGTADGGTAFICEWGEYQTSGNIVSEPIRTTSSNRDIVLVLDVSGSMSGTPMEETKKASTNFVNTILKEDASIGIVTYDNSATMLSEFSTNEAALKSIMDFIDDGGGTNIESGLQMAENMLSTSNAKKKIIVLMSDGEPNDGKTGEELIAYADSIKNEGIYIYTLGFFESLGGSKSSAQVLMEEIASDGCHYEVANADNLVFFFSDIADQINGQQYVYVRIACPVDVTVKYKGETLTSNEENFNGRTNFGSLTLEDIEDSDDKIKTLRLKSGVDYDIKIEGTGRGKMDYTIGFMNDTGEYSDLRKFRGINITKSTVIDTSTKEANNTILNVDTDGDGKYDIKYKAGENEFGVEVDYTYIIYIALAVVAVMIILIAVITIKKKFKKREVK